ncbi:MAG: alpha/beta hydrolase [Haloarculaceae archaeon]
MSDEVRVAGDRDVRASVDAPDSAAAVVACPPHPRMGGSRSDGRLQAVGDALAEREIACVRFDYGPWDEGRGERTDAANALAFARERYDPVGLFGYSFGAAVALLVAAERDPQPAAVSVLAPPASLGDAGETAAAVDALACPLQVTYRERDSTVDWEPVVSRARERGADVQSIAGDHFFVGQTGAIGGRVAGFFADALG